MPQSRGHAPVPPESPPSVSRSQHELPVVAPYRLDLTVSALRRLSTNVVDVLTADGHYIRALAGSHESVIVRATQAGPETLAVTIEGDARDRASTLALVRRMLGVDRDLAPFGRAAARLPWLSPLARRMRGVKPPRYPTLWEAFVNAIVFQQVSLQAASTIVRRLIVTLGTPLESEGTPLYLFPSAERVLMWRATSRSSRARYRSMSRRCSRHWRPSRACCITTCSLRGSKRAARWGARRSRRAEARVPSARRR